MVRELYVETPKEPVAWEKQEQLLFDFTYSGIPLPDEYVAYMKEQLNYYPGERDASMVKAEKEWDAYFLFSAEGETPRERLDHYIDWTKVSTQHDPVAEAEARCACNAQHECEAHRA